MKNEIPLDLSKGTKKAQMVDRPQTPKEPFPYTVEEVKFTNKEANVVLSGTLTLPKPSSDASKSYYGIGFNEKKGKFPIVILISGSGPQDRNEELFGHQPFKVIADDLTKKGIAVLRFDERGIGESTGDFNTATSEDFAKDVIAGIEFLKLRKDINTKQIGLIGHSEGGMVAPMIAAKRKDVAFIVLMAGPGIPIDDLLVLQAKKGGELAGADAEFLKKNAEMEAKLFDFLIENKEAENLSELLQKYIRNMLKDVPTNMKPSNKDELQSYIDKQVKTFTDPWFLYFISYNPSENLSRVKCPVLALNGSLDSQVLSKENLGGIEKSLKNGANKDFEIKELKGLNHMFQEAKTGAFSEYNQIEHTHSPLFLNTMSEWILKTISSHE